MLGGTVYPFLQCGANHPLSESIAGSSKSKDSSVLNFDQCGFCGLRVSQTKEKKSVDRFVAGFVRSSTGILHFY